MFKNIDTDIVQDHHRGGQYYFVVSFYNNLDSAHSYCISSDRFIYLVGNGMEIIYGSVPIRATTIKMKILAHEKLPNFFKI